MAFPGLKKAEDRQDVLAFLGETYNDSKRAKARASVIALIMIRQFRPFACPQLSALPLDVVKLIAKRLYATALEKDVWSEKPPQRHSNSLALFLVGAVAAGFVFVCARSLAQRLK